MIGPAELKANNPSTVVLINNDGMGSAEEPLRHKLLRVYLTMLQENGLYPGAICFYAGGVKMVAEGSPVLDLLRTLEEKGVRLIICSTCLEYFGLRDKVAVGIVGGMNDIVLAQWMANKVITL
jgi:intracellular sulfur oxidation DsrE/DsrF family protein